MLWSRTPLNPTAGTAVKPEESPSQSVTESGTLIAHGRRWEAEEGRRPIEPEHRAAIAGAGAAERPLECRRAEPAVDADPAPGAGPGRPIRHGDTNAGVGRGSGVAVRAVRSATPVGLDPHLPRLRRVHDLPLRDAHLTSACHRPPDAQRRRRRWPRRATTSRPGSWRIVRPGEHSKPGSPAVERDRPALAAPVLAERRHDRS